MSYRNMSYDKPPSYSEMILLHKQFGKLPNHNEETVFSWFRGLSDWEVFVIAWFGKGDLFGYGDGL